MDFDTHRAYRKTTLAIFCGNVNGFKNSTTEFRAMAAQHET
jgi:hypothetical protein